MSHHHARATPSYSVVNSLFRPPIIVRISENNAIPHSHALSHGFHSSAPRFSAASSASQNHHSEYSEMAWEGINAAVEAAMMNRQQIVESEHLMKALLEQEDGLSRRIFTKAGLDNTTVMQATDSFISLQPKVTGDTSGPRLGSHLSILLDNA